jgi:hypothetical protein
MLFTGYYRNKVHMVLLEIDRSSHVTSVGYAVVFGGWVAMLNHVVELIMVATM